MYHTQRGTYLCGAGRRLDHLWRSFLAFLWPRVLQGYKSRNISYRTLTALEQTTHSIFTSSRLLTLWAPPCTRVSITVVIIWSQHLATANKYLSIHIDPYIFIYSHQALCTPCLQHLNDCYFKCFIRTYMILVRAKISQAWKKIPFLSIAQKTDYVCSLTKIQTPTQS